MMKYEIYIVGMGPGREEDMTQEALTVLESCEVIVGYTVYLDLLGERFSGKTFLSTPMRQDVERSVNLQRGCRDLRDGVAHV